MRQGLIIDDYGNRIWFKNDQVHREDGAALEYPDGDKVWYVSGEVHRLDGPACEFKNSKHWYYHDQWIKEISSQEEFEQWLKYKVFL